MAAPLRLPGVPLWNALSLIGALVAGVWAFGALDRPLGEVDTAEVERLASSMTWNEARSVERSWLEGTLAQANLLAPVAGSPCASSLMSTALGWEVEAALRAEDEHRLADLALRHQEDWRVALAYASFQLQKERPLDAEGALARIYGQRAVRSRWVAGSFGAEELLAQVHFLHALGYAQLVNNSVPREYFWDVFKHAIRKVNDLATKGWTDLPPGLPTWRNHRLRSPGCAPAADDLTSFDLYNNLIAAYGRSRFEATKRQREIEFYRAYADRPTENPLQQAFEEAKSRELGSREAWVWALSNTERLVHDRYRQKAGPPEDGRLCLTIAQVMAEADHLLTGEAQDALWRQIGEMLDSAEARRSELEEEELPAFDAGVARLRALAAIDGRGALAKGCADRLKPEQCAVLGRVRTAIDTRAEATRLAPLLGAESDAIATLGDGLGDQADAWLGAVRRDTALALASAGQAAEAASEKANLGWMARAALGDEEAPAVLVALEESLPFSQTLRRLSFSLPVRIVAAVLAAALAFAVLHWWAIQMRFRKALFTSFYRLEAQRKLRGR